MTAANALVRLIAFAICAIALPCRAEDVVRGRWVGTAQIPDGELSVIVDLAQEDGAWVGSMIIPGLDVKGEALTEIAVQPPDVSFTVKGALGIQLKLRLDADNKLTGTFEQPETVQRQLCKKPDRRRWNVRRAIHRLPGKSKANGKAITKCSAIRDMCRSSSRIAKQTARP